MIKKDEKEWLRNQFLYRQNLAKGVTTNLIMKNLEIEWFFFFICCQHAEKFRSQMVSFLFIVNMSKKIRNRMASFFIYCQHDEK